MPTNGASTKKRSNAADARAGLTTKIPMTFRRRAGALYHETPDRAVSDGVGDGVGEAAGALFRPRQRFRRLSRAFWRGYCRGMFQIPVAA